MGLNQLKHADGSTTKPALGYAAFTPHLEKLAEQGVLILSKKALEKTPADVLGNGVIWIKGNKAGLEVDKFKDLNSSTGERVMVNGFSASMFEESEAIRCPLVVTQYRGELVKQLLIVELSDCIVVVDLSLISQILLSLMNMAVVGRSSIHGFLLKEIINSLGTVTDSLGNVESQRMLAMNKATTTLPYTTEAVDLSVATVTKDKPDNFSVGKDDSRLTIFPSMANGATRGADIFVVAPFAPNEFPHPVKLIVGLDGVLRVSENAAYVKLNENQETIELPLGGKATIDIRFPQAVPDGPFSKASFEITFKGDGVYTIAYRPVNQIIEA
ncbi:MAG: hypothetical protein JNK26_02725 [Candidatus Doudnabacteria bacterium]|nr:hypothetical protein [Candidatus Doudnabacteria bacterium]